MTIKVKAYIEAEYVDGDLKTQDVHVRISSNKAFQVHSEPKRLERVFYMPAIKEEVDESKLYMA